MTYSRIVCWAAALCGLVASPVAASECRLSLPSAFEGAIAYGAGDNPQVQVFGTADERALVPVAQDTRFNLGSVNKMMTAIAVGQLVDQGRMSFTDPIGHHVADLPPDIAALRIDQLLSHTGGLSLFLRPDLQPAIDSARKASSLVPLVVNEPREAPGPFRYSNAGFVLVGAAIEAVSGLTYTEYLARHIYPAAGIAPQPMQWQPGDAEGVDATSPDFARSVSRLKPWPAGSLVLSAPDLWRFGRALATGRMVKPATLGAMMAGGIELRPAQNGKPASRYGLGLAVNGDGAERTISHTGGAPGVEAALRIHPASGRAVAVLSNKSGTDDLSAAGVTRLVMDQSKPGGCSP